VSQLATIVTNNFLSLKLVINETFLIVDVSRQARST